MTAIFEETLHGTVNSVTTAHAALSTGREKAGFGTPIYNDVTTTTYNTIYKFSNGTGTHADMYLKFYNSSNSQVYQQGHEPGLTSGNPNGTLINGGGAGVPALGVDTTRYYIFSGDYRSLSFKPASGTNYGVHVYQKYDNATTKWITVCAEAFFKAQSKPASFSENLAASTIFMYGSGQMYQLGGSLNAQTIYDACHWRYLDQPYTGWSAGPSNSLGDDRSYIALACKSFFPSSYGYYSGQKMNVLGNGNQSTQNPLYYVLNNESYIAYVEGGALEIMTHLCDPVRYNVADLLNGTTAKLASPFIIRNRMLDVGVADTSDVFIGPEFEPGTILEVSASEKYTSAWGHIYLRTT